MIVLQLVKGTSRDFTLQAVNLDGSPATNIFLAIDVLSTSVWEGDTTVVLLSPTTTWVDAPNGIFQISFNNIDTSGTTPIAGVYRIQTTATRSGRSAVVLNAQLQLSAAPGTVVLSDLITQDYLQSCGEIAFSTVPSILTIQQQLLPQLTRVASRLIRKHCNRWFTRRPSVDGSLTAYDGLYTLDWPSQTVVLRQFPVNGVLRARTNPTQVFNVTNSSPANQQATATLTWTGVQDISDIAPVTTGMRLWSLASGVPTTVNLLFSTYLTFQSLAAAINAVGNGWSASIADSMYALWPTADLRQGIGPSCAIGNFAQQGFWVHTDDVPIQIDQEAGILLLDAGSNDPWTSPRFGTYLDTGLGNLDIGGGLNGVRVMYDAGWDTIPEDVQQACVETVQDMLNLLNIDQRLQSETDGAYEYDLSRIDRFALTPSVKGKLGYYQNIRS